MPVALRGLIPLAASRQAALAEHFLPAAVLLAVLAAVACWWQQLPPWPLVGVLPLSWLALREAVAPPPPRGLELRAEGCHVLEADGHWYRLHLTGPASLTPWVISLTGHWGRRRGRRARLIWRDSVPEPTFRRLARWCRWSCRPDQA